MDIKLYLDKFKSLLKGGYRFRHAGMLSAIVLAVVGWSLVGMLPNYYAANSRIYIDTQSMLKPLMRDISVNLDPDYRIQKMTRTMLSWPNLERIARMSDLDLEYSTRFEKEQFLRKMEHHIGFKQEGRSNLFTLSYQDPNPDVAKLVVQSMLSLFMEQTLSDTRTDTVVAHRFLDEKLGQFEQRLIDAEHGLAKFKRENMEHLPRQDQTYYESLQALLIELEQARLDKAIALSKKDSLEKQLHGEEPVLGLSASTDPRSLHPLMRELNELKQTYEKLVQRYTLKHPDVVQVAKQIDALTAQIDNQRNDSVWSMSEQDLNQNPVYQQIKIQLSDATAEAAAIQAREQAIMSQIESMENKVDSIIDTEAKLSNLNRDYLMNQQQYQALLLKKEAANFTEDMDDSSENFKFKIVEPPYVTAAPVWPKRGLFNLAVLFASLLGGLITAVALGQIRPTFFTKSDVEQLGVRVLGHFAFEAKAQDVIRIRREKILLISVCVGLTFVFFILHLSTRVGMAV